MSFMVIKTSYKHFSVLLAAMEKEFVTKVSPLLRQTENSDIHLSAKLIATVLELAGVSRNL